jgi:CBS domain containing-hemolysin-like protein
MLSIGLAIVAVVAAAEVVLASTSRGEVRQRMEQGDPSAHVLDRLLSQPARFLSTFMLVKIGGYLLGGAAWGVFNVSGYAGWGLLLGIWLTMVVTQILSRGFALRHPIENGLRLTPLIHWLVTLFSPLSFLLRWLGVQARGQQGQIPAESIFLSEDGLRFLLNVSEGEDLIEEDEREMIASIFEMGETVVREIMVPRPDMRALHVESSIADAVGVIIESGHSRIPVYEENVDHIIGFLYAKDLLAYFRNGRQDVSLRALLRRAYFVPQSKKLDELFHDMQAQRVHIAIVVDEYGGTAGLVTIEDLLEEIVGEIQDEYDTEDPLYQQISPNTFLFNGRIDLDEVAYLLNIDFGEAGEDVETLGGFIYTQLGRVPQQGEWVEFAQRRFQVTQIDARRIEQVRVELLPTLDLNEGLVNLEAEVRGESRSHRTETAPSPATS